MSDEMFLKTYNRYRNIMEYPSLIAHQLDSFRNLKDKDIPQILKEISPILSDNARYSIYFPDGSQFAEENGLSLVFEPGGHSVQECISNRLTYSASMIADVLMIDNETGKRRTSKMYFGELPQMTQYGSFVINGTEKVVITQLVKSPGIYFNAEKDSETGFVSQHAKIVPDKGPHIDIYIKPDKSIWLNYDRKNKMPVTTFLRMFSVVNDRTGLHSLMNGTTSDLFKLFDAELGSCASEYLLPTIEAEAALYGNLTPDSAVMWMWGNSHPTGKPDISYMRSRFSRSFSDLAAYDLKPMGRKKMNERLLQDGIVPGTFRNLTAPDLVSAIREVVRKQKSGNFLTDDIDHFANRRTRSCGELIAREFSKGMRLAEINAKNRLKFLSPEEISGVESIFDPAPVNASIHAFFATSQLCQFMDQNNPLSEIRHKRTISALGPGGLDRSRAGFEVRDIHHTHYGRVCPVETPEGKNSGLVNRYSVYAKRNEYGFIETPYRVIRKSVKALREELIDRIPLNHITDKFGRTVFAAGTRITTDAVGRIDFSSLDETAEIPVKSFVTDEVVYLDAERENPYTIALSTARLNEFREFAEEKINCRRFPEFLSEDSEKIDLMDISPQQSIGVSAGCIPFLEHDDGHRALMGTNMQAQAVPLLYPENPLVITGMERYAALDSNQMLRSPVDGFVTHAEGDHIDIVTGSRSKQRSFQRLNLRKYRETNHETCINQEPYVKTGDSVRKGDVLADTLCTHGGMTALGHNPVIAFLTWDGYNFEDAIIVSEKIIQEDKFTSLDIIPFEAKAAYTTDAGVEEITKDIPGVKKDNLAHLDERGIAKIGTLLKGGDIIIGKVAPRRTDDIDPDAHPQEALTAALFGKSAILVKDKSVRLPQDMEGRVIDVKVFTHDENPNLPADVDMLVRVSVAKRRKMEIGDKMSGRHGNKGVVSRIAPVEDMPFLQDGTPVDILLNPLGVPGRMNVGQILEVWLGWAAYRLGLRCETPVFDSATVHDIESELARAWIFDAAWSEFHEEAWEESQKTKALYLKNNPYETDPIGNLFSNTRLGEVAESPLRFGKTDTDVVLDYLSRISGISKAEIDKMPMRKRKEIVAKRWIESFGLSSAGVFVWDSIPENSPEIYPGNSAAIETCLKLWLLRNGYTGQIPDGENELRAVCESFAQNVSDPLPITGKQYLYDGRTGERYEHPTNVGIMNMIKLHHLVEDKVQGRSTATYSMITQQPLGGKAKHGGQRMGEMEIWALQGYGAAYLLQEMLTVKSDDVDGRRMANLRMQRGLPIKDVAAPGSFNVLIHELMGLCLNIFIDYRDGKRLIFGQRGKHRFIDLKTGTVFDAEKPGECAEDETCSERQISITTKDIASVGITLASPKMIRSRSCGEVTKPDLIDMKKLRPVKGGLLCETIFGPVRGYQCACGRYKGKQFENVVCENCGVEVTRADVRRERMGHIDLAAPVAHVWYSSNTPSPICILLGLSARDLRKVLYFNAYIVLSVDEQKRRILSETSQRESAESVRLAAADSNKKILEAKRKRDVQIEYYRKAPIPEDKKDTTIERVRAQCENRMEEIRHEYEELFEACSLKDQADLELLASLQPKMLLSEKSRSVFTEKYPGVIETGIGAEAIKRMLEELDLDKIIDESRQAVSSARSVQQRKKASERLKTAEAFKNSGNKPEWMILDALPVIPPDLRPMILMDGGKSACSGLNELYGSIINKNNRLKRMIAMDAPEVIRNREKRALQEAVDLLIDKSGSGRKPAANAKPIASLSRTLKGKRGRFRKNLLGKRVDFSGRSVIVVGPKLKMHQCGIPKIMALELYKPFVVARLTKTGDGMTARQAKKKIAAQDPMAWHALEQVIADRPVLLNRAPTLHRLGILAFEPVLVEGNAIQLHPLVCASFNADFDGDQMAVHLPLSENSVKEARELMLASKNLLKPSDGEPIISPSKDMVLGIYYLTMDQDAEPAQRRSFYAPEEVIYCYEDGNIGMHEKINYLAETVFDDDGKKLYKPEKRIIQTTVGRVLFNEIIPKELRFKNATFGKGAIKELIAEVFDCCGEAVCAVFGDLLKDIGFRYSMISGLTMAVSDITVPPEGNRLKQDANKKADAVNNYYMRGFLTAEERDRLTIDIWRETNDLVSKSVKAMFKPDADMSIMANSGASKGGFGPIGQLAGMRGLMADPSGRIITLPVKSNLKEGMDSLEYFIATHGTRKGLADTALKTADAGYLTRRLVDVTHDLIITTEDCGTEDGIAIKKTDTVAKQHYADRLYGRRLAEDVVDPATGILYGRKGDLVCHDTAREIEKSSVREAKVYSPITCRLKHGICRKCYGMDIAKNREVEMGAPVGTIAAQSIGEPGTQLTLRTFHSGGVAGGGDITSGLPRVEELFEARAVPKGLAVIAKTAGVVKITEIDGQRGILVAPENIRDGESREQSVSIPDGAEVSVYNGENVEKGTVLIKKGRKAVKAKFSGVVTVDSEFISVKESACKGDFYPLTPKASLRSGIENGVRVSTGDQLTEGALNPHDILKYKGREACRMYILQQVQNVYIPQGQSINVKHFELLIRKMFEKVLIQNAGDSDYGCGDLVNRLDVDAANEKLISDGRNPAVYEEVLLGISSAALLSDSWLSAASFQHTVKVLTDSAVKGKTDPLYGIKENIILGKVIPAGTGFDPDKKV